VIPDHQTTWCPGGETPPVSGGGKNRIAVCTSAVSLLSAAVAPPAPAAETQLAAPGSGRTMASKYASLTRVPKPHARTPTRPFRPDGPAHRGREPRRSSATPTPAGHRPGGAGSPQCCAPSIGTVLAYPRTRVHLPHQRQRTAQDAETTRIRGQSFYPEIADRLRQALGFQAKYELGSSPVMALRGQDQPRPRSGDRSRASTHSTRAWDSP
jgi:hypothetical protein